MDVAIHGLRRGGTDHDMRVECERIGVGGFAPVGSMGNPDDHAKHHPEGEDIVMFNCALLDLHAHYIHDIYFCGRG